MSCGDPEELILYMRDDLVDAQAAADTHHECRSNDPLLW